jgi:predicted nucleic acid-binding protein
VNQEIYVKVYLDVCCLCRPFDDQKMIRIHLEAEAIKEILMRCTQDWTLVTSDVISYEIFQIQDQKRLIRVRDITALAQERIEWDEQLDQRAEELMSTGIDAMDALHVASAERAMAVFVTTDDALIKNISKMQSNIIIRIYNPVDLYLEVKDHENKNTT